MLVPVPEYPLPVKKEIDEDSASQLDTNPYGEDGSLKVLEPNIIFGLPLSNSFLFSPFCYIVSIFIYIKSTIGL